MTLDAYLEEKNTILRGIRGKEAKIRFLYERATSSTARYRDTPGGSGGRGHAQVEGAVAEAEEIRDTIRADWERAEMLDVEFRRGLDSIGDPALAVVLELRYIEDGSWKDIAKSMGYSVRQMHRLRNEAADRLRAAEAEKSSHDVTPFHLDSLLQT